MPEVPEPEVPELGLPEPVLVVLVPAVGVAWLAAADVWLDAGVLLVCGLSRVLTTDPSALVTGSVTGWRTPETPDVTPESVDGRLPVAAWAGWARSARNSQIPPLAMANLAARRNPENDAACTRLRHRQLPVAGKLTPAVRMPGYGRPGRSRVIPAAVADRRPVRSPPYSQGVPFRDTQPEITPSPRWCWGFPLPLGPKEVTLSRYRVVEICAGCGRAVSARA